MDEVPQSLLLIYSIIHYVSPHGPYIIRFSFVIDVFLESEGHRRVHVRDHVTFRPCYLVPPLSPERMSELSTVFKLSPVYFPTITTITK